MKHVLHMKSEDSFIGIRNGYPFLKRVCMHTAIIAYILVTLSGCFFAISRMYMPFIPHILTFFSYGMMAPYQGYDHSAFQLAAEGLPVGGSEWVPIDIKKYQPYLRGERNVRSSDYSMSSSEEELQLAPKRYRMAAHQLLRLEKERGNEFSSVRLLWEDWPLSTESFDALHHETFWTRSVIMQVP